MEKLEGVAEKDLISPYFAEREGMGSELSAEGICGFLDHGYIRSRCISWLLAVLVRHSQGKETAVASRTNQIKESSTISMGHQNNE